MRATKSRTITVLLAGIGATIAVSATIGAPSAVADPGTLACQDGQIVIDGQCAVADTHANLPAPEGGGMSDGGSGMGSGGNGHK
jgi:hypothetical protein